MSEFLTMTEAEDKFGSKGKANAALTTGIIGTALGVLNGGLGGIFGGGSTATQAAVDADSMACAFVNKDTFWKQNIDIHKEFGRQEYDSLKHNYELYVALDNKITSLATKNAQLEASLPLAMQLAAVNAERYTDNKLFKAELAQCKQNGLIEYQLAHKINGTLGLPWSSIITGIPQFPACTMDVTCPGSAS